MKSSCSRPKPSVSAKKPKSSSGGSALGQGTSFAFNGTLVTNLVLSSAKAYITEMGILDVEGLKGLK